MAEQDVDVDQEFAAVAGRLARRFGEMDAAVDEATVRTSAAPLADARIGTFVAILAERRSCEVVDRMRAAPGGPATDGETRT